MMNEEDYIEFYEENVQELQDEFFQEHPDIEEVFAEWCWNKYQDYYETGVDLIHDRIKGD